LRLGIGTYYNVARVSALIGIDHRTDWGWVGVGEGEGEGSGCTASTALLAWFIWLRTVAKLLVRREVHKLFFGL
jgi:hypothetical protein